MRWYEVTVRLPAESTEAVAALLQEWPEVNGVAIEGVNEAAPPHPEWGEWFDEALLNTERQSVKAYVPETVSREDVLMRAKAILERVRRAGLAVPSDTAVEVSTVDETDWENAWKAHYQPISIGQSLAIVPTWRREDGLFLDRKVIYLEPGMAFGTGTHPTTQLCMEALERFAKPGDLVLDIGCGTGVLAMTAALLGVAQAVGIDIDPVAVSSATLNVELNGLSSSVCVEQGNLLCGWTEEGKFDMAIANILRDAVIALAPAAYLQLKPGGLFISSGYVETQCEEVVVALVAAGFEPPEKLFKEDWVVLVAVKPQ